jgi:hypothetical protein
MFAIGEDENLELLTEGPAPKRLAPVYGQALYLPASSSTSGGACLGLNPYIGPYHRTTKTIQGSLIGHLSSSHRLEHRAPPQQQRPLVKTPPMITLKLREAPAGTPPMRATSSSWWPHFEHLCKIAPKDILPSRDRKHQMPEHPATNWPRI